MTSDGTWTYTWQHGRQLATATDGTTSVSYKYNADGMRLSKTVGSTTTKYYYVGSELTYMTVGADTLHFFYDIVGPATVCYNNLYYYYVRNAQGDITQIVDTDGNVVVSYTYDAWGNVLSVTGSMASTLGALNPLRYRGYVYDAETGLYYVSTRYYDPEIGRFICADGLTSTGQGILGTNMYAYCENNPVAYNDSTGYARNYCVMLTDSGNASNTIYKSIKNSLPTPPTDEEQVLEAEKYARYKGTLVVKVPSLGSTAFSFGIIFAGTDIDEYTLRHEYGHVIHLSQIGVPAYTFTVVAPSVTGFWCNIPYDRYYSQPYEYIADVFGQVNRPNYNYNPNIDIQAEYYYKFTKIFSIIWEMGSMF